MRKYTIYTSFFLFLSFFSHPLESAIPKGLYRKIVDAHRDIRACDITFERWFKFSRRKDTLAELRHSVYCLSDSGLHNGYHEVQWLRSGIPSSLVVCSDQALHKLEYQSGFRRSLDRREGLNTLSGYQSSYLYRPFEEIQQHLQEYSETKRDEKFIYLQWNGKSESKTEAAEVFRTMLVDVHTYRVVFFETEHRSASNSQYEAYRLRELKILQTSDCKGVALHRDSLTAMIQTHPKPEKSVEPAPKLQTGLKIGSAAPFFKARFPDESLLDSGMLNRGLLLIEFFYTGCVPCIRNLPALKSVQKRFESQGLRVYGINALEDDPEKLRAYADSFSVGFPLLRAEKKVLNLYQVSGYPRTVLIKNGIIVQVFYAYRQDFETELLRAIEKQIQ